MKRILNLIFINIILLVGVFLVFDYILYVATNYNVKPQQHFDWHLNDRIEQPLLFSENKRAVMITGGSYVYGAFMYHEDTLAYKLQKLTGRKVYNYGFSSTGVQHLVSRLQTQMHIVPHLKRTSDPEYYIFLLCNEHIRGMYADFLGFNDSDKYFNYSVKNGKLVPKSTDIELMDYVKVTRFAKFLNNSIYKLTSNDKHFDILKLHLLEAKRLIQEKSENTKFVVILYKNIVKAPGHKYFVTDRWSELEKEGIIFLNFDTDEYNFLDEKEYLALDREHPSAKAWDALVPVIAEKLNL